MKQRGDGLKIPVHSEHINCVLKHLRLTLISTNYRRNVLRPYVITIDAVFTQYLENVLISLILGGSRRSIYSLVR